MLRLSDPCTSTALQSHGLEDSLILSGGGDKASERAVQSLLSNTHETLTEHNTDAALARNALLMFSSECSGGGSRDWRQQRADLRSRFQKILVVCL